MSHLTIFADNNPNVPEHSTVDPQEIATTLEIKGVRFERWEANQPLATGAGHDDILAAYASDVDRLKADNGFQTADVVGLTPDHPQKDDMRKKFLDEHVHSEDEVRFFVEGRGLFYLHIDQKVYAVMCEKNDLISVPANTRHWFDMGPAPEFTCIRLFTNPEGWVARYREDSIASKFPRFEDLSG